MHSLTPRPLKCLLVCLLLIPLGLRAETLSCASGPWGHISYQYIYLQAPDDLIDQISMPSPIPRWSFTGLSKENCRTLVSQTGLPKNLIDRLFSDPQSRLDSDGVITLFPTPQEIESLTPSVRNSLYHVLGQYPNNTYHSDPVIVPQGEVAAWLEGIKLPDRARPLVRSLLWHDGKTTCFSDFRTLISHAENEKEAHTWVQCLLRTRAVIATLNVGKNDNIPRLKQYWTAEYHYNDRLPLLESLVEMPDGGHLDLTNLLPAQPRRLVYNYITTDLLRLGPDPNCHWTSLNFFTRVQQNLYLDLKMAASQVVTNYAPVKNQPPEFGDLLLFLDKTGNAVHSCIYLADTLVFTKNGDNIIQPWIISRLPDVEEIYQRMYPGTAVAVYRKKTAPSVTFNSQP